MSVEARSCGETGEELFWKTFAPLSGKMQQLSGLTQELFALSATGLVRCDGTDKSMASRVGIVLQDQLSADRECGQLAAQPSQHPPEGAVVERPLVNFVSVGRCYVANDTVARLGRLAIGLGVVLEVSSGQMEKCRTGVAFIGEYESRDNR